jgi:uncharacterized protein (UPF0147 family)
MPRKTFSDNIEKAFNDVQGLLEGMIKDRSVPRNIKRIAQRGINELHKDEDTPGVIASNVLYLVGDLSLDPNIPFHSRSTIYRIISILETIRD